MKTTRYTSHCYAILISCMIDLLTYGVCFLYRYSDMTFRFWIKQLQDGNTWRERWSNLNYLTIMVLSPSVYFNIPKTNSMKMFLTQLVTHNIVKWCCLVFFGLCINLCLEEMRDVWLIRVLRSTDYWLGRKPTLSRTFQNYFNES